MTLGLCVKGPNNMICREWVWKRLDLGRWATVLSGFSWKPIQRWVWPEWLSLTRMGCEDLSPRNWSEKCLVLTILLFMSSFSPISLVPGSPPVNATSFPFILVFPSHSSPTCPFLIVQGGYLSYQSSRQ